MTFQVTEYIPNVAPGAYPAVCTGIEVIPAKGVNTPYRRWEFTLADGTGRTAPGTSSMQTTPGSKAGKWAAALIGRVPAVGENLTLIGQPCTIVVELNDNGYEKVTSVLPRQAAPPAAAPFRVPEDAAGTPPALPPPAPQAAPAQGIGTPTPEQPTAPLEDDQLPF